jgi:hypothetical protein
VHFHREKAGKFSCDAFEEIPVEMLLGRREHTMPISGQLNAVVYEGVENRKMDCKHREEILTKLSQTARMLIATKAIKAGDLEKVLKEKEPK